MKTQLSMPWRGARNIPLTKPGQEQHLIKHFANREDARVRLAAIALYNKFSRKYGDAVMELSSGATFPDVQTQGIPAAVTFGDSNRWSADTRWSALFNVQDRRSQTHQYFKIVDLYHAVEFKSYLLGERIELRHVEAAQEIFEAEVFAGGLQWNRFWSEWQDLWSEGQGLSAMQARYAAKQAQVAYQVLTADGLATTAYQEVDGTGINLRNDIATINAGVRELETAIYTADAGDTGMQTEEELSNASFYLLFNSGTVGYEERIALALSARVDAPNDNLSVGNVLRNVIPLPSRQVPTGAWYIVLPGRKLIGAIFRDLTIYDFNDPRIAGVGEGRIGQGAYKFVRGDSRQVRKLEAAP